MFKVVEDVHMARCYSGIDTEEVIHRPDSVGIPSEAVDGRVKHGRQRLLQQGEESRRYELR